MSFGPQPERKPADMTLEGWVTQQTDKARDLIAKGNKFKASRILRDLSNDIADDGVTHLNPCFEIPMGTSVPSILGKER
jgi:hypothetical protein